MMATTVDLTETNSYLANSPLTKPHRLSFKNNLTSLKKFCTFTVSQQNHYPSDKEFRQSQYAHHSIGRLMQWPQHKSGFLPKVKFDKAQHTRSICSYNAEDDCEGAIKNEPFATSLRDGSRSVM